MFFDIFILNSDANIPFGTNARACAIGINSKVTKL